MNEAEFETAVILELQKLSEIIATQEGASMLHIAVSVDGYVSAFMFDETDSRLMFNFSKLASKDWSDIIKIEKVKR